MFLWFGWCLLLPLNVPAQDSPIVGRPTPGQQAATVPDRTVAAAGRRAAGLETKAMALDNSAAQLQKLWSGDEARLDALGALRASNAELRAELADLRARLEELSRATPRARTDHSPSAGAGAQLAELADRLARIESEQARWSTELQAYRLPTAIETHSIGGSRGRQGTSWIVLFVEGPGGKGPLPGARVDISYRLVEGGQLRPLGSFVADRDGKVPYRIDIPDDRTVHYMEMHFAYAGDAGHQPTTARRRVGISR